MRKITRINSDGSITFEMDVTDFRNVFDGDFLEDLIEYPYNESLILRGVITGFQFPPGAKTYYMDEDDTLISE